MLNSLVQLALNPLVAVIAEGLFCSCAVAGDVDLLAHIAIRHFGLFVRANVTVVVRPICLGSDGLRGNLPDPGDVRAVQ